MDAYIYFAINVRLLRWVYCSLRQIIAVNLLFYVRACPHSGDYSGTSLGVRSVALLHDEMGEGIREGKETAILIKVLFLYRQLTPIFRHEIANHKYQKTN